MTAVRSREGGEAASHRTIPAVRVAFDVAVVRDQMTGVGVFAAAMANALAHALPHPELVLIGKRDGITGLPEQVPSSRLSGGGYYGWLQTNAARDMKRLGADIGHFCEGLVPFVRYGRTVVSIHDMSLVRMWHSHPARRLLRTPFAFVAPHMADLVIVPSRATADEVMALTRTGARKIEVVPYAPGRPMAPASDAAIRTTLKRHRLSQRGYILALGTIEPRKNHARLVEAFELLVRDGAIPSDMELVIAGHANWRAAGILGRIDASPVVRRIRLLGYVPPEDLVPLLSGAAVAAYPSLYEGFGLPVVEAMACGAPTMTSNLSSMPEVAGNAGFLVDPYDVSDIARGIADAVRASLTDRAAVAHAAIAQAGTFTWERAAATARDLYASLAP